MVQQWGNEAVHVPLLPRNCSFTFATGPDFVLHGALGHSYNHWLFSRLLEEVFPPAWSWEYLPPVQKSYGCHEKPSGKERLRETLRNLMLRLPCPRLKGMGDFVHSRGGHAQSRLKASHKVEDTELGQLSAQFESGGDGIAAVGYDRNGGTSYGKYQVSSRAGSLKDFLTFLDTEAPDLSRRLRSSGPGNTGSRRGAMAQ